MAPRPKYPTFALLCLFFAGTKSSGKITLIIPDSVFFDRQTIIQWTRSAEDPTDFGMETVPSTDIQVGDLQPDGTSGFSGTVDVVFEESSDGITVMALEAFDKSDPTDILFESNPFHVAVSSHGISNGIGKGSGKGGVIIGSTILGIGAGSRPRTSDSTASSSTTKTATSATDSTSSGTPAEPGTLTSGTRATTSVQFAGATSLSQKVFISSAETSFITGLSGPDPTAPISSPQSSNPGSNHHVPAGIIAGGIIAVLAILGILGGILFCWLRRRRRQYKTLSVNPFSSTRENSPIPNEKLLPNSNPTSPHHPPHTESAGVENRVPDTRANRTIEEMAATVQRMQSEIIRLNHHILPPAYSSPPSPQ